MNITLSRGYAIYCWRLQPPVWQLRYWTISQSESIEIVERWDVQEYVVINLETGEDEPWSRYTPENRAKLTEF